jgi:hypothetical protein
LGVAVKVRDSGMQGKEFLRSLPSFETQSASLLLPCGSVRLLDQIVAPGRRHNLDVLHANLCRIRRVVEAEGGADPEISSSGDLAASDNAFSCQSFLKNSRRVLITPSPPVCPATSAAFSIAVSVAFFDQRLPYDPQNGSKNQVCTHTIPPVVLIS